MITLHKATLKVGEGKTVSVNVDDIIALQEVPGDMIGSLTTTVFVRNCQPLSVKEKEEDIVMMIRHARALRRFARPDPDGVVKV